MNFQPGDVVRLKRVKKDVEASVTHSKTLHDMIGMVGTVSYLGTVRDIAIVEFESMRHADGASQSEPVKLMLWTEEIELVSQPEEGDAK